MRQATLGLSHLFVSLTPAAKPALIGLRLTPPRKPNTHVKRMISTASWLANSRPRSAWTVGAGMIDGFLAFTPASAQVAAIHLQELSAYRVVPTMLQEAQLTFLNVMHA